MIRSAKTSLSSKLWSLEALSPGISQPQSAFTWRSHVGGPDSFRSVRSQFAHSEIASKGICQHALILLYHFDGR